MSPTLPHGVTHVKRPTTPKRTTREAWCRTPGADRLVVPISGSDCFPCWVHGYGIVNARRHFAARFGDEALVRAIEAQPIVCDCPTCMEARRR